MSNASLTRGGTARFDEPQRFRFLATFVAGRPVEVTIVPAGELPYTDGKFVFVTASAPEQQRRELLVQAALLGAGSLDARFVKPLWGRPKLARRYLALEGRRVCAELAQRLPLAQGVADLEPTTASAEQSLQVAKARGAVAEAPAWFGVLKPSRLLATPAVQTTAAQDRDLRLELNQTELPESDDDGDREDAGESKILKLFENPLIGSEAVADFFSKLFGSSRSSSGSSSGNGNMPVRSLRRANSVGPNARPLPVPLRITAGGKPGPATGVGGALYPEWDVHGGRYRTEHCRVLELPMRSAPDVSAAGVQRDEPLRRRLSRLGLGPKALRRRPDGDDLDLEALIDLYVDLQAGYTPPPRIYVERRKIARNLGVLILVDASGSATDVDGEGASVHDHQRRAAATLAVTLEELGDRVAVYGFRSQGRNAVQCLALKPFAQRFGAGGRARLNQLEPDGYTRLGAGIRHAGEVLKTQAGTPNRLLLVLSDGHPYDDGYEAGYAEADSRRALEELRADGVACLCLSIGSSTPTDTLQRVFGAASHANAPTLAELSPRMDELFLSALKELAAPKRSRPHRKQAGV